MLRNDSISFYLCRRIRDVDSKLTGLVQLRVLALQYNEINSIPSHVAEMSNLTELNFEHNQLSEVNKRIAELTQVRCLGSCMYAYVCVYI